MSVEPLLPKVVVSEQTRTRTDKCTFGSVRTIGLVISDFLVGLSGLLPGGVLIMLRRSAVSSMNAAALDEEESLSNVPKVKVCPLDESSSTEADSSSESSSLTRNRL